MAIKATGQITITNVNDGTSLYTWIKYATSSAGANMSASPTGMTYIGLAYNKTTPTESTTASDYSWSLIKGGKGDTGVQGAPGTTTYTWIKYADNSTGSTGFSDTPLSTTQYIGLAFNKTTATESTVYTDYTWSKFKGDQGVQGNTGATGQGVQSVELQYAKNTSNTTAPVQTSTDWLTTMPSYVEGYYLWIRTKVVYVNPSSTVYSTPYLEKNWELTALTYTQYQQLQDKFTWLVKSGSSESTMVLTDTLFKLVSKNITLEGLITANNNFKILTDGSMEAINGKFTGTITGSAIRGSSNFFTAPNSSATDGYAFRIYSTGELYSGGLINVSDISSPSTKFCVLYPSGYIHASNYVNAGNGVKVSGQSLWLGIRDVTLGSASNFNLELTQQADNNVYFRPGYNGQAILGHSAYMWNKVYAVNGISSSSDRTLKENIRYLATTENARTTKSTDLTENDLYNFVKNDLITATYDFIGGDKEQIGFIAQDLLYNSDGTDNKVGQILINQSDNEQSPLTYNEKIYTNILAGALRHAILKIENLEKEINNLKGLLI